MEDNCFHAKSKYADLLFDKRSIFKFEVGLFLRFIRIANRHKTIVQIFIDIEDEDDAIMKRSMVCVRDILLKGNSISLNAYLSVSFYVEDLSFPPSYIYEATGHG